MHRNHINPGSENEMNEEDCNLTSPERLHRRETFGRIEEIVIFLLITVYVVFFTLQINQPPFERYGNWDMFWVDTILAGKLLTLKYALLNLELPSITPYFGLGWNLVGDPLPISFLSLPNLLILLLSPKAVIAIRTMFFLAFGGIGAYLFLRFITKDRWLSFLGGLTYVSLPIVISLNYRNSNLSFYPIPFFLLLIHKILERGSLKKDLLFVALSIFAISSGNLHTLVILPSVVAWYTFLVAYGYYHMGFLRAFKKVTYLVFLCVLSGSFYILPLYDNLRTNSSIQGAFQAAGLTEISAALNVQSFLDFFYKYGIQTLYKPNEGSGLLLYIPVFFYFAIALSIALWRNIFKDTPRQAVIVATLVGLGPLMFCIGLLPNVLLSGMLVLPQGVQRGHINLLPFVGVLAGFVCLATINQLKDLRKNIYALILIGSFVVDFLLFSIPYPGSADMSWFDIRHTAIEAAQSSNRVSVRFLKDMWLFLPWLNSLLVMLLFLYSYVKEISGTWLKRILNTGFIVCALVFPLLNISVHNELRATQQTNWQQVTRSPYRWNSYLKRKACIDQIIDRHNPNYRTLPTSADVFRNGRGQNWKLLAETEMNVQDREKVLFSYRETMDSYTGLLYSTFLDGGFRPSRWFPPLSSSVPGNIEVMRLVGVRWVVSADETITSPNLIYRGQCISEGPPYRDIDLTGGGAGTVYIYEVLNPMPIAFLVDDYQVVNLVKSIKGFFQKKEYPWRGSVVYLEKTPTGVIRPRDGFSRKHPLT